MVISFILKIHPFVCVRFPLQDENILATWMKAVGAQNISKNSRLCNEHFSEESFCKVRFDRISNHINFVYIAYQSNQGN